MAPAASLEADRPGGDVDLFVMLVIGTIALGLTLMLLGALVRPKPGRRRWQLAHFAAGRTGARGSASRGPDPFEALRIQSRLGVVARELQQLPMHEAAAAHRLAALRGAYDDLLAEACQLAQVPAPAPGTDGEAHRRYEEQQLAERGWSW